MSTSLPLPRIWDHMPNPFNSPPSSPLSDPEDDDQDSISKMKLLDLNDRSMHHPFEGNIMAATRGNGLSEEEEAFFASRMASETARSDDGPMGLLDWLDIEAGAKAEDEVVTGGWGVKEILGDAETDAANRIQAREFLKETASNFFVQLPYHLRLRHTKDFDQTMAVPPPHQVPIVPAQNVRLPLIDSSSGFSVDLIFRWDHGLPPSQQILPEDICRALRVMKDLYQMITQGHYQSMRSIWYTSRRLFGTKEATYKLIESVIATSGLRRRDFFTGSESKGSIVSSADLSFVTRRGERLRVSTFQKTSILEAENIASIQGGEKRPQWILLAESRALLDTLIRNGLFEREGLGYGIVLTGSGRLDGAAKRMLRILSDFFNIEKVCALGDADVGGVEIINTVAFGSMTGMYSPEQRGLAMADKLVWIGLRPSHWGRFNFKGSSWQALTPKDKTKAGFQSLAATS
ncbi:hypothetical protein L202_02987 [Cryptococcus amylolentus CBS 6039]|uniref:DNA topoisomerase (ATP-hydrolyzing) n=1 Tax=Cryptococcus amylolentus CBS 6039 TaxID=1295533 RepID=A0A1E3HXD9_9TREE|nr:hypothetical protein L202_02987 [Cryptococcus amylolentus CBS 6039]ODN80845.1 hypothetical protein L202_02987 [Cryptococcus amylolentus CBS 6039]